jgi:hypothetical protein
VRTRRLHVALVLLAVLATSRCASGLSGHTSSPWEWGAHFRAAPGFLLGQGPTTIHPMASYTLLTFDGGRDDLFEIGGQIRYPLSSFWVGGEVAASRLRTSFDNDLLPTSSNNGWSVTGLIGVPVGQSEWQLNLIGGAGISDYGGSGKNIRLGIEVHPPFINIGRRQ